VTIQKQTVWQMYAYPSGDAMKPMEVIVIDSEIKLIQELERIIQGPPQHVEIVNPEFGALCLGIGGPVAAVEWRRGSDDSAIYKVLAKVPYSGPKFEFAVDGGNYPEAPEYLMPVEQAMQIIRYCYVHHDIPSGINYLNWESVFEKLKDITP
jgi:hypothetical protein